MDGDDGGRGHIGLAGGARAQAPAPATPREMVAAYEALADTILGANKTEVKLVRAILAATYGHAQGEVARARQALKANDAAARAPAVENVATAVGQIGTEGDNAVAGIRKRLLEGGHHANAEGERQGIFDDGYVVVTKAAKQAFLESSKALAMLGSRTQGRSPGRGMEEGRGRLGQAHRARESSRGAGLLALTLALAPAARTGRLPHHISSSWTSPRAGG
jgi:hypothetical protein